MVATLEHPSLRTTLTGVEDSVTTHFRGIPYGHIPRRFAAAEKLDEYPGELQCTAYGPRCPQVPIDVGHLLRIPPSYIFPVESEDEFNCVNLDVVVPKVYHQCESKLLPVLVLIHGGSQAVTFGSAASGVCEMTTIVADSMRLGMPIMAVSVQYRLNVFALGTDDGPPNLALRDQELALRWVQDHISGFGGDPKKVTLAGESAGAVYCHAHLAIGAPVKQVILSSGSLFLSPPQPRQKILALRDVVAKQLQDLDPVLDLEVAPANKIVEAIKLAGLQSFFLEWEERLESWQTRTGNSDRLLVSDVQKEAAIWQAGVWATDSSDILDAFNAAGEQSEELKELYHIYPSRPSSCKTGALDFINDYKYLVDEYNPWQPSSGAHHAVDLPLLFAGFDLSFSRGAENVGRAMREAWIKFMNLQEPWSGASEVSYGFGPHGMIKALDDWEVQARRRIIQTCRLDKMDCALLDKTFVGLAAGKVSLLN
ncbi:hypothetical protein FGRMN_8580 [Fusarium graminum]|nr:hypothetical protein FGRMN_8580 [Fusarium graminum]